LKINDVIVAPPMPGLNPSEYPTRIMNEAMFGNPNMASRALFDKPDIGLSDALSVIDEKRPVRAASVRGVAA
jgi:hypothetical protein